LLRQATQKSYSKNVVYKSDIESKNKQKLKSDDINTMVITYKNGENLILERNNIKRIYKTLGGEIKSKTPKRKMWNIMGFYSEEIQIYTTADRYKFNRKGNLIFVSEGSTSIPSTMWTSYKRKGEESLT